MHSDGTGLLVGVRPTNRPVLGWAAILYYKGVLFHVILYVNTSPNDSSATGALDISLDGTLGELMPKRVSLAVMGVQRYMTTAPVSSMSCLYGRIVHDSGCGGYD